MKGDCEEYTGTDLVKRYRRTETPPEKINTLLSDLLEKEEEIEVCKNHLKELEAAFYYNLELISERDLEIRVLEKQLASEAEQQQAIIRERDELEDLLKALDEKKNRKIQQLETKLALKEDEMRELQKDNATNMNALKRIIGDLKTQQSKKMYKLSNRYELQKKELIKTFEEEMEEKEKYYLQEIDHLTRKLEQARREKETLFYFKKEYSNLKYKLEDVEKLFQEKENYYMEEIRKIRKLSLGQINKEVQCGLKNQGFDKIVQAEPVRIPAECQTKLTDAEEQYKKKINFLEEQNEVLKCVIKEMKKNKSETKPDESRCECSAVEMMEKVNKKFEGEINNLKKILEEDKKQRKEEEAAIQSLETSVACLKDKLLTGLHEKLQLFSGDESCSCKSKHEIQIEMQLIVLEEKLSQKIEALMSVARDERQKIYEKVEAVKRECIKQMENYLSTKEEIKNENLLEKIRLEIQKLENKIDSDLRNIIRNGLDKNNLKSNHSREDFSDIKEASFLYPDNFFDLRNIRQV